jgi:hypothetical protein
MKLDRFALSRRSAGQRELVSANALAISARR